MAFDPALLLRRSLLVTYLLLWLSLQVEASDETVEDEHEEEEAEPATAVLFPWFVLAISVVIYYLLSRYAKWLPYTGMCFLFGTIVGIANQRLDSDHLLHESIHEWWIDIDSEVLLLTFLPGLVYKDASSLNVHLFQVAFVQCLIFAFPMVLAGTSLTALVCYYIFPYDWSFNLCMTAGSILSATDPVAVSALLEAVGAPPRLKIHIAGESLINDGSAIVFFTIFGVQLYLHELDVEGYGKDVDLASGVKTFFQMSAGAVAVGAFFALGTLSLFAMLDRRLNREENVVEVALEVTIAYLCYFVAEIAWGTSGVIATVTLGVLVEAFGVTMRNDTKLAEDFASLVEHMLNTVLFTLGGLVWGSIIANSDEENSDREFTGRDWGYLVVLYLMLMVIRLLLFSTAFPLIRRIGLKSSWQEMLFQSYGGLRGAIGIALAISLDNTVRKANPDDPKFELETNKLFGFVGGIAFMTLMINATTAGPLLLKLGLADTSKVREKLLEAFHQHWRASQINELVRLVADQKCYQHVRLEVVRHHVPALKNLTANELLEAARVFRHENSHRHDYKEPKLDYMLSDLEKEPQGSTEVGHDETKEIEATKSLASGTFASTSKEAPEPGEGDVHLKSFAQTAAFVSHMQAKKRKARSRSFIVRMSLIELRRIFLELVRNAYASNGELNDREFVAFSLFQSLDLAADAVEKGEPLCDWRLSSVVEMDLRERLFSVGVVNRFLDRLAAMFGPRLAHVGPEYHHTRLEVERSIAFVHAHQRAQVVFQNELSSLDDESMSAQGGKVLTESKFQVAAAEALLLSHDRDDLEMVVSHKFCSILLLHAAEQVKQKLESGLIKPTEAEEVLEELQEALHGVNSCQLKHHEDEARPYEPTKEFNDETDREG